MKLKQFFLILISTFFVFSAYAEEPAGYASVSGHIRDEITNQAIPGVKINLQCGQIRQETFSDYSGYYKFSQVPIYKIGNSYRDQTRITAIEEKYRTGLEITQLMPGQAYTFNFSLETRFKYPIIKGKITDKTSDEEIPEAKVTASGKNGVYNATADSEGNYILRVEHKGVGEYNVTALSEGYITSEPQSLRVFPLDTYTLNFKLQKAELSVNVSPNYWHIGQTIPYSTITMNSADKITVTNDGQASATYSLNLINPSGWNVSQTAPGPNVYILNAAFDSGGQLTWNETNHSLSASAILCSITKFAGDQTGVNVAPNNTRTLWLQFKAPTSTQISSEQTINVVVTAQLP